MLEIKQSFNDNQENYLAIKISDQESEEYIKKIIQILNDLQISEHLQAEPEILSAKYQNWIGRHEFFENSNYIIHLIFADTFFCLIVKCNEEKRLEFMHTIKKYCTFPKT